MGRVSWIAALFLALAVAGCASGPNFTQIVDENPDNVVSINKLTGEEAELFLKGVEEFCPGIEQQEIYRVQVIKDNNTVTKALDASGKTLCEVDTSDPDYAQKSVAVIVNDEPITLAEVQNAINNLPQQQRSQGVANVVNSLINQELLLQEAREQDIKVSEQEVTQALEEAFNQSQVSLNTLGQQDLQRLRQDAKEQLIIQKMTASIIRSADTTVSQEEINQYYQRNRDNLTVPQTWTIRHIQVNIGDRTVEQTRQKARTVFNLLNTTSFCDLVEQFTDDTSSLDNCGRYTFASGEMLPSIESEVRQMQPNQTRIVQSQQAFHILQLLSVNQPRQAGLDEVQPQIRNFLQLQKQQQALQSYIQQLRQDAEIISYLG